MISPEPVRPVQYTEDAKRKIKRLLDEVDNLDSAIRAMELVLRRNPEDEETQAIPDHPEKRYFARKPTENPRVPGVTLLYEYDSERVLVWDIRVEESAK